MIAYKILYLTIYFAFKRSSSVFHVIQRHLFFIFIFADLGFHFQNYTHFLDNFGFLLLTTVHTKNDTRNFGLFVYLQSYSNKIKFSFSQTVQSSCNTSYFTSKMLVLFFSSNIPLYIEKNLEMKLKTYTPVSLKFIFEKIKFKVLHYIQHDFIHQCPGLSKDQTSMYKGLAIN